MPDLTGKTAIITGASGLLGEHFYNTLTVAGAKVVAADINGPWSIDVTQPESIAALFGSLPHFDILVNAAAINPQPDDTKTPFEDYPLAAWQKSLDVNLTGTMLCCQAAGKIMRKQGHGVIVNIASTYGMVAPDQRMYGDGCKPFDYCVGKAGVIHLTKCLAAYWGPHGIRVNCLSPGGVRNGQGERFVDEYSSRVPLGRMAEPDEMSGALLFLCSDASRYMTGHNLVVDGGWTAW